MRYLITLSLLVVLLVSCSSSAKIAKGNLPGFTLVEHSLIMDLDSVFPMRVLKINNIKDSIVLRTKCKNVIADPNNIKLKHFVNRLYRTVRDSISMGVGIAAPQVGVLKNIIWVQRFDKEGFPFEVYLNPKIVKYTDKKQDCVEGCLSIPDRSDTTKTRAYAILMEYDKMDGTHHKEMIEAFTAVIFQHEIDHLNGILYLDHLEKEMSDAKKVITK
ncbi:MAG: peptide deformylase [Flavobacteriaceae bacterium]|nr:peptide deformylase [Flavobacteriaceae bacterium]